jgi:hypothetical protein
MKLRRFEMNKKWMTMLGSLLILGTGLAFSADSPQKATRNSFKNTVKSEFSPGPYFVDENGDGICDRAPDRNNSGNVPPDWAKHRNEANYQNRNENNASSDHFQNRFTHQERHTWNRQDARQNRANFGNCVCDGTGQKSRSRKGNGQN